MARLLLCRTINYVWSSLSRRPPLVHSVRFSLPIYTLQEEVLFNDTNFYIPSRCLDPLQGSRPPHTGVSIPHEGAVLLILKTSRPLTRETSSYRDWDIPPRRRPFTATLLYWDNPPYCNVALRRHLPTETCYYNKCSDLLRGGHHYTALMYLDISNANTFKNLYLMQPTTGVFR